MDCWTPPPGKAKSILDRTQSPIRTRRLIRTINKILWESFHRFVHLVARPNTLLYDNWQISQPPSTNTSSVVGLKTWILQNSKAPWPNYKGRWKLTPESDGYEDGARLRNFSHRRNKMPRSLKFRSSATFKLFSTFNTTRWCRDNMRNIIWYRRWNQRLIHRGLQYLHLR